MGNWVSRLRCLGEKRSWSKGQVGPFPSADLQDLHLPRVFWASWGIHAIQVTEVTETVVTEAMEVEPGQKGRHAAQVRQDSLGVSTGGGGRRLNLSILRVSPALLHTLQSWLDGMEKLQASQGPLAADAMVAAAQLHEQEVQGMGNRAKWQHLVPSLGSSHQHTMLPHQE